jgi:hypothetical protein
VSRYLSNTEVSRDVLFLQFRNCISVVYILEVGIFGRHDSAKCPPAESFKLDNQMI